MPDVYGNPYLPSFVRNQPKMTDPMAFPATVAPVLPSRTCQITSVTGFNGAHQHAGSLTNGSSEIVAETDPNLARVYVIAVDQNGQRFVQGFNLIPVEEPKPITIDDLNEKMNKVLDRLNQLERVNANDESDNGNVVKDKFSAAIIDSGSISVSDSKGPNGSSSGSVAVKPSTSANSANN